MQAITPNLTQHGEPLYVQIYRHVAQEIASGSLKTGDRLPGKRALCAHLKVSLSTVENAYALLVAEGYLRAEDRRGFFVEPVLPLARRDLPPPEPATRAASAPTTRYDLSTSSVDTGAFPYLTWSRLMRETLRNHRELLANGDPAGESELREALSDFLYRRRGVRCDPEQIVVGAGVDYLLTQLMYLLPKDARLAMEDPGYQGAARVARLHHRTALPVPVDAQGMAVEALARSAADIAYVTPSHQFPMGVTMPIGRRTQLLHWAQGAPGRYIIEDDYDSEFRHLLRPVPAIAGLHDGGRVIYLGTFSRSLAPSLRIAYMVLPQALRREFRALQPSGGCTVSRFEQQTLARFVSEGHYARHLRKMGIVYARRCAALCEALLVVPGARIQGEEAGLHFLLTIEGKTEAQLVERAAQSGIPLRGLSAYCAHTKPDPATVVVGYAGLPDDQVEGAVQALRQAWRL